MAPSSPPLFNLNWKEIHALAAALAPRLEGSYVDRVIVPERRRFIAGFRKSEWLIRLGGGKTGSERHILFSVRPRESYFFFGEGKGPAAAAHASRSGFDLALNKHLKGLRFDGLETLPRERVLILWWKGGRTRDPADRLGLVLSLIPAVPEALLVGGGKTDPRDDSYPVIARTNTSGEERFTPPDGARAPENPPLRGEWATDLEQYSSAVRRRLDRLAWEERIQRLAKLCRESIRQLEKRKAQSRSAITHAEDEADWKRYGDLMKASLHALPPIEKDVESGATYRPIPDYAGEAGEVVRVPTDPALTPQEQLEKFYRLEKRKKRRAEESLSRHREFEESLHRWETRLQVIEALKTTPEETPLDWKKLSEAETLAGLSSAGPGTSPGKRAAKRPGWMGKSFISRDGLPILVGRNQKENQELTFRIANGNDVWLHLRGRPGAHAVILLPRSKSAPLSTLLDAAMLTIYYSGGEKSGKAEVDYTFRKYVRRIKDSTEVSYTQNKTLNVEIDAARLRELLSQDQIDTTR